MSLGYIRKATSFMVLASVSVGVPAPISLNRSLEVEEFEGGFGQSV